ncbi:MAG: T9SS type A sorting domain-containing protein [Bacteroidetes bacterium]|jgi:hypothetical protein|nr:T9SS type A sorting domain-containing protein [Bacteroidota bacterium]
MMGNRASAQYEEMVPLGINTSIIAWNAGHALPQAPLMRKKALVLSLPFFDDFSSTQVYPDPERWVDRSIFINNGFAWNPPSHGVATFDGLNAKGYPYNVDGNNAPRGCDTLTSQWIDLEGLDGNDSVYLSFYYQQKGLGDNPEKSDSLVLEFKTIAGYWLHAWANNGQDFSADYLPFKQILVKLPEMENSTLFHDSFQFRFRTWGNRTGALDHWHLDYVYLNKDRNALDTVLEDVAIYRRPKGLLKEYFSMPWRHFREDRAAFRNAGIEYNVYNKSLSVQSPDVYYTITDVTHNELLYSSFDLRNQLTDVGVYGQKTGEQDNLLPFTYFDNLDTPNVRLEIQLHAISRSIVGGPELLKENDKFTFHQYFDQYFAYDDGSAEGGYGLKNTRQGSVALRFTLRRVDTLKYVAFHFTGGFEALPEQQKFNLVVWNKLTPTPEVIARKVGLTPVYSQLINGFTMYELDEPLIVSGEFFVGWEQFTAYNLNVGIDLDYRFFNDEKPNPNLFFNATGNWENSKVLGTPMIRPVFGEPKSLGMAPVASETGMTLYPNPAANVVWVGLGGWGKGSLDFLSPQGQILYSQEHEGPVVELHIGHLPVGIYLLRFSNNEGLVQFAKLVKE